MPEQNNFKHTWRMPLSIAIFTMFGLLSALLGTGIWHVLSWIILCVPIIILLWHISKRYFSKHYKS